MTAPNPAKQRKVPRHRVAEAVAAQLRARILAGESDHHLPTQRELMEEFGVSHPSLREAIRILETEGLVTVRRGCVGGAHVHRPDETSAAYHVGLGLQSARVTLGDLASGLQLLEPICAGECARRSDRAETVIPALTASLDKAVEAVGDGVAFTKAISEFHRLLVAFTPNATTRYVVSSLVALWSSQQQAWAEELTRRGEYPSPARALVGVEAHRWLIEEIAAGNAATAEQAVRAYLAASQGVLLEKFDDGVIDVSSTRT